MTMVRGMHLHSTNDQADPEGQAFFLQRGACPPRGPAKPRPGRAGTPPPPGPAENALHKTSTGQHVPSWRHVCAQGDCSQSESFVHGLFAGFGPRAAGRIHPSAENGGATESDAPGMPGFGYRATGRIQPWREAGGAAVSTAPGMPGFGTYPVIEPMPVMFGLSSPPP